MAKRGIREATPDHTRVRLVLTAFATQLGQLRSLAERPRDNDADYPFDSALEQLRLVNEAIATTLESANGMLERQLQGDSAGPAGGTNGSGATTT
jgi:hypothetical protein